MSDKLIIENRTGWSLAAIMPYVTDVIQTGRISDNGKCYCYHSSFADGVQVSAHKNRNSDRLVVYLDEVKAHSEQEANALRSHE